MRLLVALLLCLASTAHACWDGHLISADRVTLRGARADWDIDHVRAYGRWIPRIQALLPTDRFIRDDGFNVLCRGDADSDDCVEIKATAPEEIFEEVARRLALPAAKVQAARTLKTGAWTVQLGAGERAPLSRRAHALNGGLRFSETGFAEYGGFPADNPVAFVVERRGQHALILGAWLDAAAARRALAVLERDHQLKGFVRPL